MKKVGFVIGLVVILVGVILFYPKSDNQKVLVEDNQFNQYTSLAFYIEGEDGNYTESNTLPSTGYTLNTSKSICSNNATPTWEDNKLYFNNLTKNGTSCYLYFDEYNPYAAKEYILSHYNTVLTRNDFNSTITNTTTGTIYKSLDSSQYDNDGEVYYFAGNPTDNWVQFGGFYWRIIRINGNGSIRMIYQGTSTTTTGEGTQIDTSAFNANYNDNAYVGYMYGTSGSSSYEETHANINNSTVKQVLDAWYQANIINYVSYLDNNVGFCGDRTAYIDSVGTSGGGFGVNSTYYSYIRLNMRKDSTYKCMDNDYYTGKRSNKGNKSLEYLIGLISADEVTFAGGVYGTGYVNQDYYLYTGQNYWTLSPYSFNGTYAFNLYVSSSGYLYYIGNVSSLFGVRPVINLKGDVTVTGSGTSTDPYVVEGAE